MEVQVYFNKKKLLFFSKLPPPYPNGWLSVAESTDVKCGQAISVDVIGSI